MDKIIIYWIKKYLIIYPFDFFYTISFLFSPIVRCLCALPVPEQSSISVCCLFIWFFRHLASLENSQKRRRKKTIKNVLYRYSLLSPASSSGEGKRKEVPTNHAVDGSTWRKMQQQGVARWVGIDRLGHGPRAVTATVAAFKEAIPWAERGLSTAPWPGRDGRVCAAFPVSLTIFPPFRFHYYAGSL